MGLLSGKNNFILWISNEVLISIHKRIIFISEVEYETAIKRYPDKTKLLFYIPFGVDIDFWSDLKDIKDDNKSLLFVGNDLNRDYSF